MKECQLLTVSNSLRQRICIMTRGQRPRHRSRLTASASSRGEAGGGEGGTWERGEGELGNCSL